MALSRKQMAGMVGREMCEAVQGAVLELQA